MHISLNNKSDSILTKLNAQFKARSYKKKITTKIKGFYRA